MASITPEGGSAITCDILDGAVRALAPRVDVWHVNGVDGYGVHTFGLGDSAWRLRAVRWQSASGSPNFWDWWSEIQACRGLLCSVTDSHGQTYTDLLVRDVRLVSSRLVVRAGEEVYRGEVHLEGVRLP